MIVKDGENEYEEWLELENGCLCCTIKDNGVTAIEKLLERNKNFDYILLETSGVADPGPIANVFWMDDGLASSIYLDGIVTVLDAGNIGKSLDDISKSDHVHHGKIEHEPMSTALVQISQADILILNKIDTVTSEQLTDIKKRITGINSAAPIFETTYSKIPWDKLFDLKAYEARFDETKFDDHGYHDSRISTISFSFGRVSEEELQKFESWLQLLLWEEDKLEIHRAKGRIVLTNGEVKILQGVRESYEIVDAKSAVEPEILESEHPSKLVLIGKNLDLEDIKIRFTTAVGMNVK